MVIIRVCILISTFTVPSFDFLTIIDHAQVDRRCGGVKLMRGTEIGGYFPPSGLLFLGCCSGT